MESPTQPETINDPMENDHQDQPSVDVPPDITPLEDFDWEDLQRRFTEEMEAKQREEQQIQEEFARLMNVQ